MTAQALADELEVSVRTVYRDLEALSGIGIPVWTESGPGGGCQLVDGYRTPFGGLSRDEAASLLALGVPAPLRDLGLGPSLQSAQRRIGASSGIADRARTVHLDMPNWFRRADDTPQLPVVAASIRDRRSIDLTYRTASRSKKHERLAPLGIVNKAGVWYLVAASSGETRVFRLARIESVRVRDDTFARPPDFDLAEFWEAWSADFEATRPQIRVVVRASPRAVDVMPEVFGEAVRDALANASGPDDEGWIELVLTFEHEAAAAHRLAGFGGSIEVRAPESVRIRLIETATATLARYRPHR
jgi:predicted DNA-binding transcriptional regulator YafY